MSAKPSIKRWLPGDPVPADQVKRMVRVDHAGEHGAARIYEGQLAILGKRPVGETIRHMAAQEREHRAQFDKLLVERRVRPTLLGPVWDMAGYALGAATALMGERAAMACTVAVEEVIDGHYTAQLETLGEIEAQGSAEPELRQTVEAFRAEELEHRDTALEQGAEQAPGYRLLSRVIKAGCRAAIAISERI